MAEYETPSFLQGTSADDWMKFIIDNTPADLDKSAGGHFWNKTRPTALVAAFLCEYHFPEIIKIFNPEWSYGTYLDEIAKTRGIVRRAATAATGSLTIAGSVGATIPQGSTFATASINDEPSVSYRTLADAEIPAEGSITIDVECTQTGTVGNTSVNTVILVSSRLTGITAVTNPEAISGGTEEEADESLRERIADYDKSQGESFVGSPADYKRWAESVPGVGEATVISAQDDSGLITIIVTDANGDPATEDLCTDVYNYIMRPDSPAERLAEINAKLSITPPLTMAIAIRATIELENEATIESVKSAFLKKLTTEYLPEAMDDGEVKYSRIWSVLSTVEGVNDFTGLEIGINSSGSITYGTANISITNTQLPSVSEADLVLTSGTV